MINIYVGNLPYSVDSNELREIFESHGEVGSAEVIFDRRTKRSRGYGFVEMGNDENARGAIAALNGSDFQGRELRVDESQAKDPDAERPRQPRNNDNPQRQHAPQRAQPEAAASAGGLLGFVKKIFG